MRKTGRKYENSGSGHPSGTNVKEKAMSLLLYRSRSEMELRERLCRDGFSEEEVQEALSYVKSFGYVNDRRYAENYALSMQDRTSRMAIRAQLRQKGVEDSLIWEAIEGLETTEEEVLEQMIRKKAGEPHRLDEKEMRRLYGFLARRGFAGSAIRKAVSSYERCEES